MAETEINQIPYLGMESLKFLSAAISKNYVSHKELELALSSLPNTTPQQSSKFYKVISDKLTASELISDGNLSNITFNNGDFLYGLNGEKYILFVKQNEWIEISRSYEVTSGGGDTPIVNAEIATYTSAGIVMPSEEDFTIDNSDSKKGLLNLKPVSIKKISGLQEALDSKANTTDVYTKTEVNALLLASMSASDLADISVLNKQTLDQEEYLSKPIGTLANITDSSGSEILETYILCDSDGTKEWKKVDSHDESIGERLTALEEKSDDSGSWGTF